MSAITIYQKPTCTTCRQVYAALKEAGVDFEAVNYYTDPIPAAKLRDLLRTTEEIYKTRGLARRELTDDELIVEMTTYPDLIQRPIVEKGDRAILARPASRLTDIL